MTNLNLPIKSFNGHNITSVTPLHGGSIGQVSLIKTENKDKVVLKRADYDLSIEASMLKFLKCESSLPVPEIYHSSEDYLLMEYIEHDSHINSVSQIHAAEILAALHNIQNKRFGFENNNLIASIEQKNNFYDSWPDFFAENRIMYLAKLCYESGKLKTETFSKLSSFANHIKKWIPENKSPSLIHGDMWTSNILSLNNEIVGFIDPSIYYADPEIELAFSTLFGTFGKPFFDAYKHFHPLEEDFFRLRKDLYNIYPLLVHRFLFGQSYEYDILEKLKLVGL